MKKIQDLASVKNIFLVGLVIFPLVFWPWSKIAFEVPRVVFINLWIVLLVVRSCLSFLSTTKQRKRNVDNILVYLVFIFIAVSLLSSLLGSNITKSILGNYYRADGLLTLIHLIALFIVLVFSYEKSWFKSTAKAIAVGSFLVSLWSVYYAVQLYFFSNLFIPNWEGAIGVSFGNPILLSGYLTVSLPFVFYLLTKEKERKGLWIIFAVIQITAILLTFAWAGIALIFVTLSGYLLIKVKMKSSKKLILPLVSIFVFILIASIPLYQKYIVNPKGPHLFMNRRRILTKGFLAFQQKPLLGWGWANFDHAFDETIWPIKYEHDIYVDKAHSTLLEVLTTTGIVGVIFYIAIVVKAGSNLYKEKSIESQFLLLTLLVFIIHSQTNVISIAEEVVFWIILGISARN